MKSFKDKIEGISVKQNKDWKTESKFRRDSKWLLYSSEIALRILALIESNEELSQSKLAKALDVSPQQISKIIKGKENLTLETIYKLSQALQFELITFPPYKDSYSLGSMYATMPFGNALDYNKLSTLKVSEEKNANTKEAYSWNINVNELIA